jgi:hypothetical protein
MLSVRRGFDCGTLTEEEVLIQARIFSVFAASHVGDENNSKLALFSSAKTFKRVDNGDDSSNLVSKSTRVVFGE